MILYDSLPTHLARTAARLQIQGGENSAETFLLASYLAEASIKTVSVALCAGIEAASPANAYRIKYGLIRADGLGVWEEAISTISSHSYAGYVPQDLQPLIAWLTKKRTRSEDQWVEEALENCYKILERIGVEGLRRPRTPKCTHLISQLVVLRNKTKAHGAVGIDFFAKNTPDYLASIWAFVENCPAMGWDWYHLSNRSSSGSIRAIRLKGLAPALLAAEEAEQLRYAGEGIHFSAHNKGSCFSCGDLFQSNLECSRFLLPNGSFSPQSGHTEFLDYSTGAIERLEATAYLTPPAPLPPSATEGRGELEVQSNVFGNLPSLSPGYVERPRLQDHLRGKLLDKNHTIITLHGRGGIGKTSVALFVVHQLAALNDPPFEFVIWFSARDLELRATGPSEVRRAVPNLETAAKLFGHLVSVNGTPEAFAEILRRPSSIAESGILFVFDNFETFDDPRGLHKFLDTHTHIPNKVLLTSRERAFESGFPIDVRGMEMPEAAELLRRHSIDLGIDGIVARDVVQDIYDYTEGHPYAMRVLLGEIAKERQWIPLKSLIPRRLDLLGAIFERSFNRLTQDGRRIFLTISNWRSTSSEISLIAVLNHHGINVEQALEECLRLSLISREFLADGQQAFSAPEMARIFGRKKLEGDPDRLVIQEDLELLRQFGPSRPGQGGSISRDEIVQRFLAWSVDQIPTANREVLERLEMTLQTVAEMWPKAWLALAGFRKIAKRSAGDIGYCYRRAVEEMPYSYEVWLARADFAQRQGDQATYIASLVSAVDAAPNQVDLAREVASLVSG
jgi:hypothetical protein